MNICVYTLFHSFTIISNATLKNSSKFTENIPKTNGQKKLKTLMCTTNKKDQKIFKLNIQLLYQFKADKRISSEFFHVLYIFF